MGSCTTHVMYANAAVCEDGIKKRLEQMIHLETKRNSNVTKRNSLLYKSHNPQA